MCRRGGAECLLLASSGVLLPRTLRARRDSCPVQGSEELTGGLAAAVPRRRLLQQPDLPR